MPTFQNSYMITNRAAPVTATSWANINPLAAGELFFFTASGQYNGEATDYQPASQTPSTTPPQSFLSALKADLAETSVNGASQITVFVHGLDNLFTNAVTSMTNLGSNLQADAQYGGLVIGFSWPSYTGIDNFLDYASFPYAFPPTGTSGTIRDNINGSTQSFISLLNLLQGLDAASISFVCHSEGNYMMMLGMLAATQQVNIPLDQVLLVAADINTGALQMPVDGEPLTGQAAAIASSANRVSVYYSSGDDVLPVSKDLLSCYHNPDYTDRLGLSGPSSFDTGALQTNVYGVDCSRVINESNIKNYPEVPPGTTAHSAYIYVPQVIQDMSQTLFGVAAADVVNRTDLGAPDDQSFQMTLVPVTESLAEGFARLRARREG